MRRLFCLFACVALFSGCTTYHLTGSLKVPNDLEYEVSILKGSPDLEVGVVYRREMLKQRPAVMVLGIPNRVLGEATEARPHVDPAMLPEWSTDLIDDGYMLVTWRKAVPAEGQEPPAEDKPLPPFDKWVSRVIDYLGERGDVNMAKIGWFGASASGIPALSVAAQEKRIAAIMVFVSSNKPEFAEKIYPTAVLIVNGGADTAIKPEWAREYFNAAKPYYEDDPWRLRLVFYEGETHNLPLDVVKLYATHWFRLYINPTQDPPTPPAWLLKERDGD